MGKFMQKLANFQDKRSISYLLRIKRVRLLNKYIQNCFGDEQRIEILDLGGTQKFWKIFQTPITLRANITLVNLTLENTTESNFRSLVGDARCLPQFADKQFDIVFSNSVIEHVGNFEEQNRMANEIKRIGKYYFIQTPNRNFPIEPHFLLPFFQFLPIRLQIFLVIHWSIGQYPKATTEKNALKIINSVNLLCVYQIKMLFNESCFYYERILGLTKSIIVFKCLGN